MLFKSNKRSSRIKKISDQIKKDNEDIISRVLQQWESIYTGAEITSAIHEKLNDSERRLAWVAGKFKGIQASIDIVASQSSCAINFPFREIEAFKLLKSFVEMYHEDILIKCFNRHYPSDPRINQIKQGICDAMVQSKVRVNEASKTFANLDKSKIARLKKHKAPSLPRTYSTVQIIAQGNSALERQDSSLLRKTSLEAFAGNDFGLILLYYNNTKTRNRTTYMQLLDDIYASPKKDTRTEIKQAYKHIELYFDLVNIITTLGRYKTQLIDPDLAFNLITASEGSDEFESFVKSLALRIQHEEERTQVMDPSLALVIFISQILDTTLKLIKKWQDFIKGPLSGRLNDAPQVKNDAEEYLDQFKQQRNTILHCIVDLMPTSMLDKIIRSSSVQKEKTSSQFSKV